MFTVNHLFSNFNEIRGVEGEKEKIRAETVKNADRESLRLVSQISNLYEIACLRAKSRRKSSIGGKVNVGAMKWDGKKRGLVLSRAGGNTGQVVAVEVATQK